MVEFKVGFGSDNHSGVHPEIFAALAEANQGHAPSYGTDPISQRANLVLKSHFGAEAEGYFVFNGTAANVLSLRALVRPHHSVLVAETSHLWNDECGAPEFHCGAKLVPVPSRDGKLSPEALEPFLLRRGDQHFSQVKAVSITQPTELGTVYDLKELEDLKAFARKHGLRVHVDGARLVNAAAALGADLGEITRAAGAEALSLGGTKNGLMFGEAVVLFSREATEDFKYVRKQELQLPSKTRFIAAQFERFLGTDLWLRNARHANRMAARLAEGLRALPFIEITQPTQANAVFARLPKAMIAPLREHYFFYVWNEKTFEARLMTTFDTREEDVDGFARLAARIARELQLDSPREDR